MHFAVRLMQFLISLKSDLAGTRVKEPSASHRMANAGRTVALPLRIDAVRPRRNRLV